MSIADVDITPRLVALLKTGLFQHPQCTHCPRMHLPLLAALTTAPCGHCVRALRAAQRMTPARGRQWSKAYLAFIQAGARWSDPTIDAPTRDTTVKRALTDGVVGDELLQACIVTAVIS
jgi:hypothetical protein